MELRHLRYFIAVAKTGSYRAAADQLRVAQPALWQQVQGLQRELGVELFERHGRNVRITRSGSVLLEQADRVIATVDRLRQAAADLHSGRHGVLAIACYTPHLERVLAPMIGRFQQAHPGVRIELREFAGSGGDVRSTAASYVALRAGDADVATGPRPEAGIEGFKIDESEVVALVPRDHPWSSRTTIDLGSLGSAALLLHASRDSFSRSALDEAFRRSGVEPSVKLQSLSATALARLAENRVGVAVLPNAVVPADFSGVTLRIVGAGDTLRREVWLCWRAGGPESAAAKAFLTVARASSHGNPKGGRESESDDS